jgi:beta-1,4-mannosyltransferase
MRVLAFPAFASRSNNPYTSSLYDALSTLGVEVHEYRQLSAWSQWAPGARRYDVVHVHWPEVPLNRNRWTSRFDSRAFLLGIDALRARGAKLVWTVHNLRSHTQRFPEREARFFESFTRRVDGFISLSRSGEAVARERFPALSGRPGFVIPHHHYRGTYEDRVTRDEARRELGVRSEAKLLLFFGQVMAYKNLPSLVTAVRAVAASEGVELLVAGRPKTEADERELRAATADEPRIRLELGFVPHQRAQFYFRAADLVVLPYKEILNSGAALLSLSFDRPVLLPELGACRELGEQIEGDWVMNYGELAPEVLIGALDRARRLPEHTDGRQLAAVDVERTARQTLEAYRALSG